MMPLNFLQLVSVLANHFEIIIHCPKVSLDRCIKENIELLNDDFVPVQCRILYLT